MNPRIRERAVVLLEAFPSESKRLLPAVVVTGAVGGLIGAGYVALMRVLIDRLFPEYWSNLAHWGILLVAGVLIAVLVRLLGDPGDTELLVDNIHVSGGSDDVRKLVPLIPVSLIGIGVGGGIGPEAPLTQTTGTVGTWVAEHFKLPRKGVRTCTITGMAAGFTVLFTTPLGGAVFALEILHRKGLEYYEALMPAVVGALVGYGVFTATTHWGLEPIWSFPPVPEVLRMSDLGWAVVCGVAGAIVAVTFTAVSLGFRALFRPLPPWAKPVAAAALLGAVAYVSPYALTFSEFQLMELSTMQTVGGSVLLLAALGHLLSAPITMAGQWKGGFIIPLFFMGYCLARAAHPYLPASDEVVLCAAMMAACNVGVTKTPLGSTITVTGMAGLRLLPTTLIASIVCLFLTSGVGLLESQRRREGTHGESVDARVPDASNIARPDVPARVPAGAGAPGLPFSIGPIPGVDLDGGVGVEAPDVDAGRTVSGHTGTGGSDDPAGDGLAQDDG